jgi:hypothetical protein
MELIIDFIRSRAAAYKNNVKLGLIISSALAAFGIGLVISSGLLINTIEFLGIILGSLGGVVFLFLSIFIPSLFIKDNFVDNLKHKFGISVRRRIALIAGIIYLIAIVMSGGDGTNPWLGASTILVFGWLAFFFVVTPLEKEAIEEAADEIVWMYENEELEKELEKDLEDDSEYIYDDESEINDSPESENSK